MGRPKGSKNLPKRVVIAQEPSIPSKIYTPAHKSAKLSVNQTDKPVSQGFSVTDLCRIINTANSCNVKSLRVYGIEVEFGEKSSDAEVPFVREDKTLRAKTLATAAHMKADFDRAQMIFDDPVGFENQEIEALSQGT